MTIFPSLCIAIVLTVPFGHAVHRHNDLSNVHDVLKRQILMDVLALTTVKSPQTIIFQSDSIASAHTVQFAFGS